jgi:hypothetical protein
VLLELMRTGEQERTRLAAVRELFDRGFGRPVQQMELATTTSAGEIAEMPKSERIEMLEAALAAEQGHDGERLIQ